MVLERISAVHTTYQLLRSVRDCPEVRPPHPLRGRGRCIRERCWCGRGAARIGLEVVRPACHQTTPLFTLSAART